ncbi:GNAT family N-acetyltransferase [Kitasatospora sp. LaBMicrA B282]|uniref:GNAT family N-acetyltransferase n=1 Tax=Kitasatospora sp. LaBMicrA B282 TaxID=3420949 RepID=UPI003D0D956E
MTGVPRAVDQVIIRAIEERDWPGIAALETAVYTPLGLSEGRAALESRARTSPATCFVLEHDRRTAGYLLALPYPPGRFPQLDRPEGSAERSDNLHLHDLVIGAPHRGRGLARQLLAHLTATAAAAGYRRISLVAVGGSDTFWAAQGFAGCPEVAVPDGYGPGALYMASAVPPAPSASPLPHAHHVHHVHHVQQGSR